VRGTPIDIEYRLHEMAGVAAELARTRAEIGQLDLGVGEGSPPPTTSPATAT